MAKEERLQNTTVNPYTVVRTALFSHPPQHLQPLTRNLRFIASRITPRQIAISRAVVNNAVRDRVVIEHHSYAVVTVQPDVIEHEIPFGQFPIQTLILIIISDPPPRVSRKLSPPRFPQTLQESSKLSARASLIETRRHKASPAAPS